MKNINTAVGSMRKAPANKSRLIFFLLLAGLIIQVVFILIILGQFSIKKNQNIMELETPLDSRFLTKLCDIPVHSREILNTVTVLSGTSGSYMIGGEEKFLEKDEGQMFWVAIEEKTNNNDNLLRIARRYLKEDNYRKFEKKITGDEILSFIFGTGEREEAFINNWRDLAKRRMKFSSILPWKKQVDFAVLPGFGLENTGGLQYFANRYPGLPIFCPPFNKSVLFKRSKAFDSISTLVPLPAGYTSLTPNMGAFVSTIGNPGEGSNSYELSLIIHTKEEEIILSGQGLPGPLKLVEDIKKATTGNILYYIGGTNMNLVIENESHVKEIEQLKKLAPNLRIYPNHNTSNIAHRLLERTFKRNYHRVSPGSIIKIKKKRQNK